MVTSLLVQMTLLWHNGLVADSDDVVDCGYIAVVIATVEFNS